MAAVQPEPWLRALITTTNNNNNNNNIPGIFNNHKSVVDIMLIPLHPPPIVKNFFPNIKLSIIFVCNVFLISKK
jgi:hypothetical protein